MNARASSVPTSWPTTSIVPDVASSMPAAIRSSVVLPLPLWPMSTTRSPDWTARSTGPSAGASPYVFTSWRAASAVTIF